MSLIPFKFNFPGLYMPEIKSLKAVLLRAQSPQSIVSITGATTLTKDHFDKTIRSTGATNAPVTVPPNTTVAFPVGTKLRLMRGGSGTLTVVAGAGVTVNVQSGKSAGVLAQHGEITITKVATNEWVANGELAAA